MVQTGDFLILFINSNPATLKISRRITTDEFLKIKHKKHGFGTYCIYSTIHRLQYSRNSEDYVIYFHKEEEKRVLVVDNIGIYNSPTPWYDGTFFC